MIWRALWLVLLLWPMAAGAQADLPAVFRVVGVAADDILNIRAGPNVGYAIIGGLSPGLDQVEVTGRSDDGRWLRVNTGERSGWAAAHFLQRQGPNWSSGLPTSMRCFGTEPFWGFSVAEGVGVYRPMGEDAQVYGEVWSMAAMGSLGTFTARFNSETAQLTWVVSRQICSDGMSDRLYGLSTTLLLEGGGLGYAHAGCCTLGP